MTLPQRPLGSTGLHVSVLGLGTVKFGRNTKIKYPTFELPSDRAIEELLDDALALGINLLDTAPAYGLAEERLGQLLGARREQFVISTKCGEEFADGESAYNFSAVHTRMSVERSLHRLKTDRLDCVLAHCPRNDFEAMSNGAVLETLAALKQEGKIRSFGASINTQQGGALALARGADVLMITYSADELGMEWFIRQQARGVGVVIKKGLGSGSLAGNSAPRSLEESFRPIFSVPGVTSLIIGTINLKHLHENVQAVASVTGAG